MRKEADMATVPVPYAPGATRKMLAAGFLALLLGGVATGLIMQSVPGPEPLAVPRPATLPAAGIDIEAVRARAFSPTSPDIEAVRATAFTSSLQRLDIEAVRAQSFVFTPVFPSPDVEAVRAMSYAEAAPVRLDVEAIRAQHYSG